MAASRQHVFEGHHVDGAKLLSRSPIAHVRCGIDHEVNALHRGRQRFGIGKISLNLLHSQAIQDVTIARASNHRSNRIPFLQSTPGQ